MFHLNLTGAEGFLVAAHADRREYLPNYADVNGNAFLSLSPPNFHRLGFGIKVGTVRKYEVT